MTNRHACRQDETAQRSALPACCPPTVASPRCCLVTVILHLQSAEEDEPYVYLPPGSSMREPGYSSVSDPMEVRKVYRRDPVPADAKE